MLAPLGPERREIWNASVYLLHNKYKKSIFLVEMIQFIFATVFEENVLNSKAFLSEDDCEREEMKCGKTR